MDAKVLATVTSVPVWRDGDYLLFDRKYYDGTCLYVDLWPGIVRCIMGELSEGLPDFGLIKKRQNELPFELILKEYGTPISQKHLDGVSVVLASGDNYFNFNIASLCLRSGVECYYTIEYTPETRYQIVKVESANWLKLWRRYFYVWAGERKRKKAFLLASGIQANGGAAYEYYKQMVKDVIFYYDTRVKRDSLAHKSDIKQRCGNGSGPLKLAFSGRLNRMKGVDHLLLLCSILKKRGIEYSMSIYGAGDLKGEMSEYVSQHGLSSKVMLKGVVDFESELLPIMKSQVDVFVCLHRQSDPSCTYLETLSCGVPILGYLNRAFAYILDEADIGWGVELDDLEGLADMISKLAKNRYLVEEKSYNALSFASQNTFHDSFRKRINQLRNSVGLIS